MDPGGEETPRSSRPRHFTHTTHMETEQQPTKMLRLRNGGGIESWHTEAEAEHYKVVSESGTKDWAAGWTYLGFVEVTDVRNDNCDALWAEKQKETGKSAGSVGGNETPAEKKGKGK